jgi:hypothetical protein
MMPRPVGALIAAMLAAGCSSSPPKFWEAACRDEMAVVRHETPAPAGLAVPAGVWVAFKVLAYSGAAWVEHDSAGYPNHIYEDGPGRYRIWLAKIDDPACRQALRDDGIDPDTRQQVPRHPAATVFGSREACLGVERLGDRVGTGFGAGTQEPIDRQFEGWTAPYLLTTTGGQDPRSEADDPVWRSVILVVSRETLKPIFEAPGLSYSPKTNWFPSIHACGAEPVGAIGLTERELVGVFRLGSDPGEGAQKP